MTDKPDESIVPIVDVHTHFLPADVVQATSFDTPGVDYRVRITDGDGDQLFAAAGQAGGFELAQLVDPARRIADMRQMGVTRQVLSVPPPFGFFHTQEPDLALAACRRLNDGVAQVVRMYPDQFIGMATLPMHHPKLAADELARAVEELGLSGAEIATRVGPLNLDDPSLRPFFDAAQDLSAPVFVHSTRGLGADRLAAYHLGNLIGNPTEDAIAAASLIFGGVLDLYPELRIYLAHGGGSCAFLAGRWDRGWQVRPEAREHLPAAPSTYLRRLAFDSLTHGDAQLGFLVEQAGVGQVMLGTDYPYDMGDPDPVARIVAQGLGDADRDRVLGGNAAAMFGF
jgi:aminocarboxymuconate-semialdehyde decarboxylase